MYTIFLPPQQGTLTDAGDGDGDGDGENILKRKNTFKNNICLNIFLLYYLFCIFVYFVYFNKYIYLVLVYI